jgi:serine/threonine-protein kinase RsbW
VGDGSEPVITLTVPATAASIAVVRTVTASVASELALPFDAVDDLRIAVAEACNRLFALRVPGERLHLELRPTPDKLTLALSIDTSDASWPRDDHDHSLAWKVIAGLTDHVDERLVDGRPTIVAELKTLPVAR